MKIIDWYIFKKFMLTFSFCLGLILMIAIVFDFTEQISGFYDSKPDWKDVIFVYYKNFALKYGLLMSSFFTFISVIIFTSGMAGRTEIVPIFTSGVSFWRFLKPYFVGAGIITVVSLICLQWYLPHASSDSYAFEVKHVHNRKASTYEKIHTQVDKNISAYFGSYNTKTKRGTQFTLEQFNGLQLDSKLMADVVMFRADSAKWQVENWHERQFVEGKEILTKGKSKTIDLKLLPEHVVSLVKQAHLLDYQQITEKIEMDKKRGSDSVQFYEVELHQRNAAAFSNIILTIIAVSLASKKTRGGLGINLSIGLALVMFYLLINKFGVTFAQYSDLNPIIAAWLPNIFYGVVAIILFRKAQK